MDFLRAEIANKRKASGSPSEGAGKDDGAASPSASKYMRRGEERLRREQEEKEAAERKREVAKKERERNKSWWATRKLEKEAAATEGSKSPASARATSGSPAPGTPSAVAAGDTAPAEAPAAVEAFNISREETVRRLRAKGQPIRLFGESERDTRLRLRAFELLEGHESGRVKGGGNDFQAALRGAESGIAAIEDAERRFAAEKAKGAATRTTENGEGEDGDEDGDKKEAKMEGKSSASQAAGIGMDAVLDLDLIKKDMNKLYPIIYYTLKGLLADWAQSMIERPADVRESTQGKMVAATQMQSAEYLKPLFKSLRKRALPPDVLARIAEIVHFMQRREYRYANDSYLQLSIGNAPWPIGVTMVGIHERSGREKIFSSNVAHVLNDEVSRKYIQSLKRLMTFAQVKYPPAQASMLMG